VLGLAIVAAMLMLFVAFLLSLAVFWMAWDEDACTTRDPAHEGTRITQSSKVWPPGTECSYVQGGGETTDRFVDAGPWDPLKWPVLALLVMAPLTLGAGLFASIRDLRSGSPPEPSRTIGGITT
jgi:hypothetical protein